MMNTFFDIKRATKTKIDFIAKLVPTYLTVPMHAIVSYHRFNL